MNPAESCRSHLERALSAIAPQIERTRLDELRVLIDTSMQAPTRHYHTLAHALMVGGEDDPLEILIGLCHDIAQVDIDGGLPAAAEPKLRGLIDRDATGHFTLIDDERTRADRAFEIARLGFGLTRGQTLSTFRGRNEFLSALAALKTLGPAVESATMAALVIGIEATIPFRNDSPTVTQRALDALDEIDRCHGLSLSNDHRRDLVRRSVRIANRDVASFGGEDLDAFLDETWDLLRETAPELRASRPITLDTYRRTVQKMTDFLGAISAPKVFRAFDGEPDEAQFRGTLAITTENLRVISGVMQTKLLAVALLEAATENARGALITPQVTSRSAGPATKSSARTVEAILARGKDATAEFDMRQSPLSYRIAATMSPMQIRELSAEIDPASPLDGRWLARLPNELTSQAKTLAHSMFAD